MSADKGTTAQQPQLIKILEGLLKQPENRDCVDCGTKAPRWASTNLGVFMCIRCSGIHRSMGVHISKVKSVSLDKWSPEQVEFMQKMGNGKGKEIYEAHVPSTYHKGNIAMENMALEQWIRDKYERKRFMVRDGAEPVTHREYKEQRPRDPHAQRNPEYSGRERESARPVQAVIRAPVSSISAKPLAHAPSISTKPPAPAPTKDFDLLNFDEPVRTPQELAPTGQDNDFFGDYNSAGAQNNQSVATPPQKDKNAILQLFNAPPVMPVSYGMQGMHPQQPPMMYPGPNYNISLQQGVFPSGYNHSYNMGRGVGTYPGSGGMPNLYPGQGYPPQTGYPGQGYPQQGYPPQSGYLPQQGFPPQQGYAGQQQYANFGGQSQSPNMGAQLGRGTQQSGRTAQPQSGPGGANNLVGLNSLNFHL